jgi:N6-adenosine-specific RNA methylase IME4
MDKKYQIIYADPPWKQAKGGLRKIRPNQLREFEYPVLYLDKIEWFLSQFSKMGSYSHNFFIWTIDKYLWDIENMMTGLGYRRHARFIWDKENGIAPAFTVRYSHEYLLWFYMGLFQPVSKDWQGKYTTIIREKSTKHSKKPIKAYEMIENLYPNTNKLELFARNKRSGWDVWGNEVESDIELPTTKKG